MQNRPPAPPGRGQPPGQGAYGPPSFIESTEYLRGGYLDERGNTRPELITRDAERVADELYRGRMNNAQLRRFFAKIRYVESRLDAGIDFADLRAQIVALCPAAVDAVNRGVAPRAFRTFMEKNVELAKKDEANFRKGLVQHFQSIVCYFPRQQGQ